MTTLTVSDIPLETTSPAQRLRRMAAAVRVVRVHCSRRVAAFDEGAR